MVRGVDDVTQDRFESLRAPWSFREREEIALLRAGGAGVREISRQVGRAPSTISRELRRNAATRGGKLEDRPSVAQWKADLVARRPKPAKLVVNDELRHYVQERLSGEVRRPDGMVRGPSTGPWKGRNKPASSINHRRGTLRVRRGWYGLPRPREHPPVSTLEPLSLAECSSGIFRPGRRQRVCTRRRPLALA